MNEMYKRPLMQNHFFTGLYASPSGAKYPEYQMESVKEVWISKKVLLSVIKDKRWTLDYVCVLLEPIK
jgi:hypothetical protein